ncbi:MAG: hypothetical protein QW063_00760 [Candidatus Nanoarchaeia archaeon]
MAVARNATYTITFIFIIIILSLILGMRQTGFFAIEIFQITIDGDFSDWQSILANNNSVIYDGPWDNMTDFDAPKWAARDLTRFAFAQDDYYLYFYFERVAGHESVDFFVYLDTDNDGLMETGEFVINFNWVKDSGDYIMSYYTYVASNSFGDDIISCGDGCTMPGNNVWGQNNVERLPGANLSYTCLEARFAKSLINLTNNNLQMHISSALGQNVPNQVVDNMGYFATAKDKTPPTIHWINATPDLAIVGQIVNFTAKIIDNIAVSFAMIDVNGTNYTMVKDGDDIWYYSWNATIAGDYNYTVCANDTSNNWACKTSNFTVLMPRLAIALSPVLASGVEWNITSLPVYNYSANGNNGTGITQYYVIVEAIGVNADLYVKANGDLVSETNSIPLANEKLSFNITDSTVPDSVKKSLTTNYIDNKIGSNMTNITKSWLKFFLDVSSGQQAGIYNNTLIFKVVQASYPP